MARVSWPSGAPAPARITTSPTTSPVRTWRAADTSAAAPSTTSSANIGRTATLSGTPSAASCANRKPASASCRACARRRPPAPRASDSPPRSAPARPWSAAAARWALQSPPAGKPQRPSSRPNGRPPCRLVPSPVSPPHICAENGRFSSGTAAGGRRRAYTRPDPRADAGAADSPAPAGIDPHGGRPCRAVNGPLVLVPIRCAKEAG